MSGVRFAVALATLLFILAAPAAHAGTYTVKSCWGPGQTDGWTPVRYGSTALEFLSGCAPSTGTKSGLGAFARPQHGVSADGTRYGWEFTAPPRTQIVGLTGEYSWIVHPDYADDPDSWSPLIWRPDRVGPADELLLKSPWNTINPAFLGIGLFPTSRIGIGFGCRGVADGCRLWGADADPATQARLEQGMTARNLTLTIRDDEPPAITPTALPPDGWHRAGDVSLGFRTADNVGISRTWFEVADVERAIPARNCDAGAQNTYAQPCSTPAPEATLGVDINTLGEGTHVIKFLAQDVAQNVTRFETRLRIDHSPPGAPRGLKLLGTQAWRSDNRYAVEWVNPPEDARSPIDIVEYELCPAANPPYDERGCVKGSRDAGSGRIDDLAVPSPGEWRLRVALRDEAGNIDWDRSAMLETLRHDGNLPNVTFLPFDPLDPARIHVSAEDDTSGVARVEIEARRRGDSVWHVLESAGTNGRYSAWLDDDRLIEGNYDLRARVIDHAGNERATGRFAGGQAAEIRLPVRSATQLAVGRPERVRVKGSRGKRPQYRKVLVAKPQANYGEPVIVEGTLSDQAGNPRAAASVQVLEQVNLPGREWRHLATIQADRSGNILFRALPGPARMLRFVYGGTSTTRARTEDVELRVRAGVTLTPSRRQVANGDDVIFRGRLLGTPVPQAGKLLALQAKTARGWRTFATPRARAGDGKWSFRYRFLGTPVTSRYAFRVIVPQEDGYPYAHGVSKVAKVLVRGS